MTEEQFKVWDALFEKHAGDMLVYVQVDPPGVLGVKQRLMTQASFLMALNELHRESNG